MERRGGGRRPAFIIYSLGSLIFDRPGAASDSALLNLRLSRGGVTSARITPLRLVSCQPRPAQGEVARTILHHLASISRPFHTKFDGSEIVLPR